MKVMKDLEVKGDVITQSDPRYDKARSLFYGGVDKHPAAIVRVANAQDVARVVEHARETGAELAIRSGGHNPLGYSLSEGGIVVDLHDMRRVDVDVPSRTARAETGATAVEFATAAGAHGLGVSFGDTGSVGLGGITLGGGVGYLVRQHGLTIDNLIAAEVVTADGVVRHVDAESEPDLFWRYAAAAAISASRHASAFASTRSIPLWAACSCSRPAPSWCTRSSRSPRRRRMSSRRSRT